MNRRVVLGMSGGVDSSVAAYLLQKDGFEVIGTTLLIKQACAHCTRQNEKDARNVARMLGIAHFSIDISLPFEEKVISYFEKEYARGRTPNPCAVCNREVKFNILFEKANQLKAHHVATGHYARILRSDSKYYLARSEDPHKDQSYFLSRLHPRWLEHLSFPLGTFKKQNVIDIAKKVGLPVHEKDESQEICFIPENDYRSFLMGRLPELQRPGAILTTKGEVIGEHEGIMLYTIGQRRGIPVQSTKALYVVSINPSENSITVGEEPEVMKKRFRARSLNWLAPEEKIRQTCEVKIRSQHAAAKARLVLDASYISIEFEEPQFAVTPGQLAVCYDGDIVLGSGWIE